MPHSKCCCWSKKRVCTSAVEWANRIYTRTAYRDDLHKARGGRAERSKQATRGAGVFAGARRTRFQERAGLANSPERTDGRPLRIRMKRQHNRNNHNKTAGAERAGGERKRENKRRRDRRKWPRITIGAYCANPGTVRLTNEAWRWYFSFDAHAQKPP